VHPSCPTLKAEKDKVYMSAHYQTHFTIFKLERFLDHLNGLHRNMEMEKDGLLSFLDSDIYRRPDGSLVHKVYQKSTHSNLYLKLISHHHSSNIQAICSTLVHRVLWVTKTAS
jgi:hypothetical protein